MALLVLAYPKMKSEAYNLIQEFRKINDPLFYQVVEPHFTIVFPVVDFNKEKFIEEARNTCNTMKAIDFEIRCATVSKDAFKDYYHLFLVPDLGYSSIVKLHDRMYSGFLSGELRLDIDFIPHISIANSQDPTIVKRWADEWNSKEFIITGTIDTLSVVDYHENVVTGLIAFDLG